jgi:hypothetical protein
MTGERIPRNASDNGVIKFVPKAEIVPAEKAVWSSGFVAVKQRLVPAPFLDQRIKFARPPDLYLRNHSFLI